MLDGMPQNMTAAEAQADGADRISALPDGILRHVLEFLEADEAVRTSLLARRWNGLWRFMRTLRITRSGTTISSCRNLVDHLLNLCGHSTLDACFFSFTYGDNVSLLKDDSLSKDDVNCLNRWTRYALLQEVQLLSVDVQRPREDTLLLSFLNNLRLVSQSLIKLQLVGVDLQSNSLDFSRCLALKELNLTKCDIIDDTDNIYSPSLACLRFHECGFLEERRVRISTPNLISLEMTGCSGSTPIFEYMPALVTAIVIFNHKSEDRCYNGDPGYCADDSCAWCYGIDDGSAGCVLLGGLSAATNLKLLSAPQVFLIRRDLRFCPTFSKLKTLLLNGWCVVGEQCAVACILQHSPVLEELTIDLYTEQLDDELPEIINKQIVPSKAIYNYSMEQSLTMENLNKVEVKCHEVNQWVFDVTRSLITYGIPLHKISIEQKSRPSECLNFVCVGFRSSQN
ncbi:unnamed protein product [Urochloa decumbens]|uniref:F-box domain-containing protein n=1 Tax=Urochloa decumbens TaxID=240449 RepID=A0ABC9AWU9_9POAL